MTIARALLTGAVVSAAVVVGLPSVAAADDARTLTVCGEGCDKSTIAAAVAAAAAGDTVLITEDQTVAAAVSVSKAITITGSDGVVITRTGTSANVFAIGPNGDGATISNLEITSDRVPSADPEKPNLGVPAGAFISINAADDVTLDGNTIYGPDQAGPMSGWVTNRAWTNNKVSGLSVTDNTFHSLRTGGYIDGGSGVLADNVTYNTKGDYLLGEQAKFEISGNTAGNVTKPSEWGIVIFAVNATPYDVPALGAANDCLTVWDQDTGVTVGDAYGHGTCLGDEDGDGIRDTAPPTSKDDCKQGGWAAFNNPTFRNQGECVSSVAKQDSVAKRIPVAKQISMAKQK